MDPHFKSRPDCATAITVVAIVICVIEEPVDAAAHVYADAFRTLDSNDAVSSDEGQPKEVVSHFVSGVFIYSHCLKRQICCRHFD